MISNVFSMGSEVAPSLSKGRMDGQESTLGVLSVGERDLERDLDPCFQCK